MKQADGARQGSPDAVGTLPRHSPFPTIHLTVVRDGCVHQQYLFSQPSITLGRQAGVDLVLDDVAVSRLHAEVSLESGRYVLHDLGSANGMRLNDEDVVSKELGTGDVIQLPPFAIHVTIGGEPRPESEVRSAIHDETTHGS